DFIGAEHKAGSGGGAHGPPPPGLTRVGPHFPHDQLSKSLLKNFSLQKFFFKETPTNLEKKKKSLKTRFTSLF
ncbi:hypothetical protein ACVGXP_07460, partial [Enterobacter hormaechei]